jgi:hypothetical protein
MRGEVGLIGTLRKLTIFMQAKASTLQQPLRGVLMVKRRTPDVWFLIEKRRFWSETCL